jgi:hypothetical protein
MFIPALHRLDSIRLGAVLMLSTHSVMAQVPADSAGPARDAGRPSLEQKVTELSQEVADSKTLVLKLQEQLAKASPQAAVPETPAPVAAASAPGRAAPATSAVATTAPSFLPAGVTINGVLDGYYESLLSKFA